MSELVPRHHYTFEEYLELEEVASVRHEFYDGEIYAMAGGTPEHAAMTAVITSALGAQIEGSDCRVYSSDLRVRVLATGLATYPDVTIVCGPSERDPSSNSHVTNPKLVVEVLSPSTEDYDRTEKLQHYKQIPSLDAVVLVGHTSASIQLWTRDERGWMLNAFGEGETVPLEAVSATLNVDSIYAAARNA